MNPPFINRANNVGDGSKTELLGMYGYGYYPDLNS